MQASGKGGSGRAGGFNQSRTPQSGHFGIPDGRNAVAGGNSRRSQTVWRLAIACDGGLEIRILADTNLFIKFCRRLPLPAQVERVLADEKAERCLSPVSVIELFRLWRRGDIPDNPDSWLDLALPSWTVLPVTVAIARLSVLWPWEHKDPADRILAATAECERIEFWHTDTVLKKLTGFPHRFFSNPSEHPSGKPAA